MANGRKLSVGLVFDDSLDGNDGVAQYVKTLGGWLSGQGHEVSYLVGETKIKDWQGGAVYSLSKNLKVKFNGNKLTMPLVSKKSAISRALSSKKFDVLHVMTPYSPLMAKRIIRLAGQETAVVGTFHIMPAGAISHAGSRLLSVWLRRSLKRFDAMASVSEPARLFASTAYGIKSVVIPNPVNLSKFNRTKTKIDSNKIVFLGRLVRRKGCRELLLAFARVASQNDKARLVIAGDGPQRKQLERLCAQLSLAGRVEFLGYIDEAKKPDFLGSAAIACFPSLYGESFGIVLIEAMAAGSQAVLGGDNPGYGSVLAAGPHLLVDPRDTAEFAARLDSLLKNDALRLQASEWQRQAVKQYDIEVVGARIINLYREAIARRHKNGHNNPL